MSNTLTIRLAILSGIALATLSPAASASSQVSGYVETAASATSIYGPVNDGLHPEHNCPVGIHPTDCWWKWHCCEDGHGHALHPFLNLCVKEPERECATCVDQCVAACVADCGGNVACRNNCKPSRCGGCRRAPDCGNAADFLVRGQCGIDWRPHVPAGIRPGAIEEFEALGDP